MGEFFTPSPWHINRINIGFITIRGRVSRQYFEERIYGVRKEEQNYASIQG